MKYTHNEEGHLVYSVGADGRDDGGRLTADLPRGRMPGTVPPPDIGVRVSYPR